MPKFPAGLDDLRSTEKCPMCLEPTGHARVCPNCGLDLANPALGAVFEQSIIAADALVTRGTLLATIWQDARTPAVPDAPQVAQAQAPQPLQAEQAQHPWQPAPSQPAPPQPAPPQPAKSSGEPNGQVDHASTPPGPAPEATPRRSGIQVLLLAIGVSFVSIAAIVFLTVAFVLFDLTVKSIITVGVTAAVIALASWLKRRRLTSTAEGVAILGAVLLGLDLWAARAMNLFGLERIDGTLFWGVGLLLLTAILLIWGRLANVRAPRIASTFAFGPGVFALARWIFDWGLGEYSSILIGLAGVTTASLIAPIVHRRNGRSDALEVGLVFGFGQLAALLLAISTVITGSGKSIEEATAGLATCLIAVTALIGQLRQLERDGTLQRIRWQRISATILATVLWGFAIVIGLVDLPAAIAGDTADTATRFWNVAPFIALAAVAWDVLYLRSNRRDRPRWLTGLVTTGALTLAPAFWLLTEVFRLPYLRSATIDRSTDEIDLPVLIAGLSLTVAAGIAVAVYQWLASSQSGVARRSVIAWVVGAAGLAVIAMALPLVPAVIALGLLMVTSTVAVGVFRRRSSESLRFVLQAAYVATAIALVLTTVLHTPHAAVSFLAVTAGFLTLRLLRGDAGSIPLTLATAIAAITTTVLGWLPGNYPTVHTAVALIAPLLLLLVSTWWRAIECTDRRILTWTATPLLFLSALQQLPLSFTDGAVAPQSTGAMYLALAIAFVGLVALVIGTLVAARGATPQPDAQGWADALARAVSLVAILPLTYIVINPLLQAATSQTIVETSEVLFAWAPVLTALTSAGLVLLLRRLSVPEPWTTTSEALAIVAAWLAMTQHVLLVAADEIAVRPFAFVALAIAIAVPLTASVRSKPAVPAGRIRGAFPWLAAATLAAFGPLLVFIIVEQAWPVLVAAPAALAFAIAAAVFQLSGQASRMPRGAWVLAALVTIGAALALVTLVASRGAAGVTQGWMLAALGAALSIFLLATATFTRTSVHWLPTRALLATVLAPFGSYALITAARYGLGGEGLGRAPALGLEIQAYALAIAIAVATAAGVFFAQRGALATASAPIRTLQRISLSVIAVVAFAALTLSTRALDLSLAAWVFGLVLVLTIQKLPAIVDAIVSRSVTSATVLIAAGGTLAATTSGQQLETPIVALGVTVFGIAVGCILAYQERRTAHPATARLLTARILTLVTVPVAIWAALLAAPVAWPWWMLVATSAITVAATLGAAILPRRADLAMRIAAGDTVVLPLVTALFVADDSIRVWPYTWLTIGVALLALGFAVSGILGPIMRGSGTLLALVSSATLLWPAESSAAALLVSIPGCAVLAGMAIATARSTADSRRIETGAYAAAIPLWFAAIAIAAADAVPGTTHVVALVGMLVLSVLATAGVTSGALQRHAAQLPLLLLSASSAIAAIIHLVAAVVGDADVPVDVYYVAFGLAATATGALWMRARPRLRSFPALGPGLILTLLPLWYLEASTPTATRIGIYTVLVLAAVLVGALGKLQAPLLLGTIAAIAHVIVAIRWMLPELSVPWWVWLGSAGAILIFVAATYESRLRNAKLLVRSIAQLR
ncbi:SCO7613 C-terminal domain-containing membrane protein [Gulosibacter molinativorax]|uniref:SCO7613 C-terminal domain-containing membrane protein n=1 Tax=Gulosibacter molinativorax TaxID=256821 RepID=UPI0012EC89E2|nr:hypothetical protein [Gulosibacter molinativorax]